MEEKNQASVGLIILSILFPIVGIILYFVKKNEENGPAGVYLGCAIAGFIIGLLLLL